MIPGDLAHRAYDLLVLHCGASADTDDRERFVAFHTRSHPDAHTEWRFQGSLGFGGKFWTQAWAEAPFDLRVTHYPEDHTPARCAAVETVNKALRALAAHHHEKGTCP